MKRWIAITMLALLLVACGFAGIDAGIQLFKTQVELAGTQAELAQTQIELTDTQAELAQTQIELTDTQAELETAQQEATHWETVASAAHPVHFSSKQELVAWLAQDDTDSHEYIPDTFDCDDFALTLQQHALGDGYIISCEYVPEDDHMLNTAIIGNFGYKIEPQMDEVTFWFFLD